MAIDAHPVPAEHRPFVRQNLFSGIYKPPTHDDINVNIYQDFVFTWVGGASYFEMATGVNVLLSHTFEFGAFCSYIPQIVNIPNASSTSEVKNHSLQLRPYYYCGNMFAYVPLADKNFHPKVWIDVGLGNANGIATDKTTKIERRVNYVFAVVKPALALEMNLFSFLQWTLAAQYRFQISVDGPSDDLGMKSSGVELSTGLVIHI